MNSELTVVFARVAGIQSFRSATVFAVIVYEHIVGNCQQWAVDADLSRNDDLSNKKYNEILQFNLSINRSVPSKNTTKQKNLIATLTRKLLQ